MLPRPVAARRLVVLFWVSVLIAIPVWGHFDASGWDLSIYRSAMRAVHAGFDPYAVSISAQVAYHDRLALHLPVSADEPYNYVYSPVTLLLLRVLGMFPEWLSGLGYWLTYAAAVLAVLWTEMQAVEEGERIYFAFFAPVAVFFPGLLENGVILSGNVAFLLYGLVFATAAVGWRSGRWRWFYAAVLVASCFKPPLLTLLVIPGLLVAGQWLVAGSVACCGVILFALQRLVSPALFAHFLTAIDLQMRYNRDFGASPAALVAGFLLDRGRAYFYPSLLFYLAYAVPLFALLVTLSLRFKRGEFSLARWLPVMLVGVILLNPRIIEYDLGILTIPLALIVWRLFPQLSRSWYAAAVALAVFICVNVAAAQSWIVWKEIACFVAVTVFAAGVWQLRREHQTFLRSRENERGVLAAV